MRQRWAERTDVAARTVQGEERCNEDVVFVLWAPRSSPRMSMERN